MVPTPRRRGLRLGCMGSLVFALAVATGVTALLTPWAFHIGGQWTLGYWTGVGRIRDSAGAEYGLYVYFLPWARGTSRLSHRFPHIGLRGDASVCTAYGTTYPLKLSGEIYGAYLNTDGADQMFYLDERGNQRPYRHFRLFGTWRGPNLVMDDHKTMFMYIQPDGRFTPTRSYTSPVPEKHATVTLTAGGRGDFQALCAGLQRVK